MYKEDPIDSTIDTIQIFLTLMEAMKKYNVKKIVHASTSAVYEGNALPYRETLPIRPPELKSLSKQMNEEIGNIYASSYGITSIALRPMSVYGDDESIKGGYANVISLFVWAMVGGRIPIVWGDGNQTRDFIHTDDAAEVFCLALEKDIPTQPLNVGTGIETSFNQVIENINSLRKTQIKPEYVPVPINIYARRLLSDNSSVKNVLGFEPKISVREGIQRVITYAESKVKDNKDLAEKQIYYKTLNEKFVLAPKS
jgi:nucleoside-diphosphate-sugar epimerase